MPQKRILFVSWNVGGFRFFRLDELVLDLLNQLDVQLFCNCDHRDELLFFLLSRHLELSRLHIFSDSFFASEGNPIAKSGTSILFMVSFSDCSCVKRIRR